MNPEVKTLFQQYLSNWPGRQGRRCLPCRRPLSGSRTQPVRHQSATHGAGSRQVPTCPTHKVLSWIRSGRLQGYNVAEKENGRPKYRVNPEHLEAFTKMRMPLQPIPKGRPPGRQIPQPKWRPHL